MKNIGLWVFNGFTVLLISSGLNFLEAQPFTGYNSSLYSGIHSLDYQPAFHRRYSPKWDINPISLRFTFLNNNLLRNASVINGIDSKISSINEILNIENSNTNIEALIQFPSTMFRINEKSSFAITTGFRGLFINDVSGFDFYNFIQKIKTSPTGDVSFQNQFWSGILLSWVEIGLGYARQSELGNDFRLGYGFTVKMIDGAASAYYDLGNLNFNYQNDTLKNLSFSFEYAVSEEIEKLSNEGSISLINNPGFGIDFGVTIEKIDPDNPEMYKYKFGFAVTDLGMLKHESSSNSSFNQVTVENLSFNRLRNLTTIDQLFDTINSLANITQEKSGKKGNRLPLTEQKSYSPDNQCYNGILYGHCIRP